MITYVYVCLECNLKFLNGSTIGNIFIQLIIIAIAANEAFQLSRYMKHVDIYLSEKSGNTLIYGIGKNVQLEMYVAEQKVKTLLI